MSRTLPYSSEKITMPNSAKYWEDRYQQDQTGWDLAGPTPVLQAVMATISKDARILIPGCGLGWDGEALHKAGYRHVYLSDWAESAKRAFLTRVPDFPEDRFLTGDFFTWSTESPWIDHFDLVLECTFYCAIPPEKRENYVQRMAQILRPGGQICGLLFTFPLTDQGPPFGGSTEEYRQRFSPPFELTALRPHPLSIKARADKEVYFCATLQSL